MAIKLPLVANLVLRQIQKKKKKKKNSNITVKTTNLLLCPTFCFSLKQIIQPLQTHQYQNVLTYTSYQGYETVSNESAPSVTDNTVVSH